MDRYEQSQADRAVLRRIGREALDRIRAGRYTRDDVRLVRSWIDADRTATDDERQAAVDA